MLLKHSQADEGRSPIAAVQINTPSSRTAGDQIRFLLADIDPRLRHRHAAWQSLESIAWQFPASRCFARGPPQLHSCCEVVSTADSRRLSRAATENLHPLRPGSASGTGPGPDSPGRIPARRAGKRACHRGFASRHPTVGRPKLMIIDPGAIDPSESPHNQHVNSWSDRICSASRLPPSPN
jgi:hypothetical protein